MIGHPVGHSASPAIHEAGYAALGLDWTFVAFDVAPGQGAAAVAAMRTLGLAGLSVTMPHKGAVLGAVDRLDETAAALGAVNCIHLEGGELVGTNTDGQGFVTSLALDHGIEVAGRDVVVLGAGGAARAVVRSLGLAGAASIRVVARRPEAAAAAAALAADRGAVGALDDVEGASLVVNATPVGMGGDTASPVPERLLGAHQVVADLVYHPRETPLLAAAARAGAQPVGGLGMLVGQAAIAFELFCGVAPPREELWRGALGSSTG